jgi:WhiB family redox-sensing transcriptional regulator
VTTAPEPATPTTALSAHERALLRWFPHLHDGTGDWRELAACSSVDPDLWHPEGDEVITKGRRAKTICRSCPVQIECLEHALTHDENLGIWGGLTPIERRRLKPGQATPTCRNGHAQSDDNVRYTSAGPRCRLCQNETSRRAKRKREAQG